MCGYRRSIRLRGYDYTREGAYFVTILTHQQDRSLCGITPGPEGDALVVLKDVGAIADRCWSEIPQHFPHVRLDAFQLMPDHLHGIIVIAAPPPPASHEEERNGIHPDGRLMPTGRAAGSLGAIVSSFKSAVTRLANLERGTPGAKVWQQGYYEVIIRDPGQHMRIADYIERNPAAWLRKYG